MVSYASPSSLTELLALAKGDAPLVANLPPPETPFGLKAWVEDHKAAFPGNDALQKNVSGRGGGDGVGGGSRERERAPTPAPSPPTLPPPHPHPPPIKQLDSWVADYEDEEARRKAAAAAAAAEDGWTVVVRHGGRKKTSGDGVSVGAVAPAVAAAALQAKQAKQESDFYRFQRREAKRNGECGCGGWIVWEWRPQRQAGGDRVLTLTNLFPPLPPHRTRRPSR